MANLGFVGLGMMGSRIARRLLAGGHTVTGYNRTRSKIQPLLDAGLRSADSPRAVAEAADLTLSMVTDSAALSSIADGPDGLLAGLSSGKTWLDMSTVSPRLIRGLAAKAAAQGAHLLDGPVSGSLPAAEGGTLIFFVGGDAAALDGIRPILEALSQKIVYMGANGQGVTIKIAINLNLATQLVSLFESLLLAERGGLERAAALDALLNSVMASPAMKYRAPFILKMPAEVWFSVTMMQKDLLLALDLGRELGVPLPSVAHANEMLTAARALGYGDQDFAALFKVAATLAGLAE